MRHPSFLKIGLRVKATGRFGDTRTGRVDGNDMKANGVWVAVNFAKKGENRVLKHFRPTQLTPV